MKRLNHCAASNPRLGPNFDPLPCSRARQIHRSQFKFLPESLDEGYVSARAAKVPANKVQHTYTQMPLDWFDSDDEDEDDEATALMEAEYDPEANQGSSALSSFIASEMGDNNVLTNEEKKLLDERHKMMLFREMLRNGLKLTRIETKYIVPNGRRHLSAHKTEVDGMMEEDGEEAPPESAADEEGLSEKEKEELESSASKKAGAKEAGANKKVLMEKIEGKVTTRRVNRVLQLTGDGETLLWRPPKMETEGAASPFEDGGATSIPKFDVLHMRKPKVAHHEGGHAKEGGLGDSYDIIRIEFDRPRPKTRQADMELRKVLRQAITNEFTEDFRKMKVKYPIVKVPKDDGSGKFEKMKIEYLDDFHLYCKVERIVEKLGSVGITSAFDLCMASRPLLDSLIEKRTEALEEKFAAKKEEKRTQLVEKETAEEEIEKTMKNIDDEKKKELATYELLIVEHDIPRLKGIGYTYSQTSHMDILCSDPQELKLLQTGFKCFYKYHARRLQKKASDPKQKLKKMVAIPRTYEERWAKNGYVPLTAQTLDENDDVKNLYIGCGKSTEDLILLVSGTLVLFMFMVTIFGILLKAQLDGDETGLVLWSFFWMLLVVVGVSSLVFYLNNVDPAKLGLNEIVEETDNVSGRFLPVLKRKKQKMDCKGAVNEVKNLLCAGVCVGVEEKMNLQLEKKLGFLASIIMIQRELFWGTIDCLLYIIWKRAYYQPFTRITLIQRQLRPDGQIVTDCWHHFFIFKVVPRANAVSFILSNLTYVILWIGNFWKKVEDNDVEEHEDPGFFWFWVLMGEVFLLVLPTMYVRIRIICLPENVHWAKQQVVTTCMNACALCKAICYKVFVFICCESCAYVINLYKENNNTRKAASKNMGVTAIERRQRRLMKNKTRKQKLASMASNAETKVAS